jgi:hypothetical protein
MRLLTGTIFLSLFPACLGGGKTPDDTQLEVPEGDTDTDTDADGDTDADTDADTDTTPCSRGAYGDDIEVTAPSDLDGLEGYTSISGSLDVNCASCTDLDPLYCLESIEGHLYLKYNSTSLREVDGLSNLASLGGYLDIHGCDSLTDVDGLAGLSSIGGTLHVEGDGSLQDLSGLQGVTSINGALNITQNDDLGTLGLDSLTTVRGDFDVTFNVSLPNCQATALRDQVTSISGDVCIVTNQSDSCPNDC